jgi:hypothetical protein
VEEIDDDELEPTILDKVIQNHQLYLKEYNTNI